MLIVTKSESSSNGKLPSIQEVVLKLARRRKGVTREEATLVIGKDVYTVFQRLRRAKLIRPGTFQRKSRAGKSIDIFHAVANKVRVHIKDSCR